jgi:hypothetical protein
MDKAKLIKQADEMVSLHDGLSYECVEDGIDFEGIYWLDHTYGGSHLCEDYGIKIHVPWIFPLFPPTIWETSGKIPVDGAFEHFLRTPGNALCLGASCDLFSLLEQNPTIVGFVDRVLPSYLYAAKYFYRYGSAPQYGERPHGLEGTIQAYKERYNVQADELFIELLSMLMGIKPYRGHTLCPCGSEHKLRDCHGKQLIVDINSKYRNYYCFDAYNIIVYYTNKRKAEHENTRRFSKAL